MIRAATPADVPACAALLARTWQRAYQDFIAAADMPTVDELRERWESDGLDGASVFEVEGRVVGVLRVGTSSEEADVGALMVLYVEPAAQGAGIGGRLHDHALDALRARAFAAATLWTYSANGQARDFYAARGWRPDGAGGVWRNARALRLRRDL